ncbi:MAG: PilZ domain-containing protein [Candidatus Methylomirabilales bacterium]
MVEKSERRRVARLTVPSHLGGFELEIRLVQLLELSSEGARIEHAEHLHEGLVCFVDLPPALGRVRLTGEVVWTRLHKGEQTFEGDKHLYYQSGLVFIGITPEQQTALAAALEILRTGE